MICLSPSTGHFRAGLLAAVAVALIFPRALTAESGADLDPPGETDSVKSTVARTEENLPLIPISLATVTTNPASLEVYTEDTGKWLVQALDQHFKTGRGERLARFQFVGLVPLEKLRASGCSLFQDKEENLRYKKFISCKETDIRRLDALNIVLYDNGKTNQQSWGGYYILRKGKKTWYYPRIQLHWLAVKKKNRGVLLHEAGHAFGLPHVAHEAKGSGFPNNVMRSRGGRPLADKERGYYFTDSQTVTIKDRVSLAVQTFTN